jgi:hypothetical protein
VGGGTITGVTRNGASFAYASSIVSTPSGITIKTLALPTAASNGDAYVVSVTDGANVDYSVAFEVVR